MGLYDKFKTSSEAELQGTQFIIENQRVTLARAGGDNKPFTKAMSDWYAKNKKAIDYDAITTETGRAMLIDLYSRFIVLDWETNSTPDASEPTWISGIESEDGGVIPFNVENVVLTLNALPDVLTLFKQLAENGQNYRSALVGKITKN